MGHVYFVITRAKDAAQVLCSIDVLRVTQTLESIIQETIPVNAPKKHMTTATISNVPLAITVV
jgi:hypothetical protein